MSEKKKQEIPVMFKLDDFFSTQNERDENSKEHIEEVDISLIDDFTNHPFKVLKNNELIALEESIKNNGILSPTIIRKKENGRYEMISGHRRKFAAKELGYQKIPCIIKDLNDVEATIFMVDSNMSREKILPSERAYAYKMKYEALKHQGRRNDLSFGPVDRRTTSEIIGEEDGSSEKTIRRYIRLTYLIPELLELVDNSELGLIPTMAIRPAVEVSYLKKDEQTILYNFIEMEEATPSLAQAKLLKKLSVENRLNSEKIEDIMFELKPNQKMKTKLNEEKLNEVIPKNIAVEQRGKFIYKACEFYSKHLKSIDRER